MATFVMWVLQVSIWSWVWMAYYADNIMRPFGYKGNWLVVAVYGLLFLLFTRFYGGYQVGYYRKWDLAVSNLLSLLLTNSVTYFQTCLVGRAIMDFKPFVGMTLVQAVLALLWVQTAGVLFRHLFPPFKILIVHGGGETAANLMNKMIFREDRYCIEETVSLETGFETVCSKILAYKVVILCDLPAKMRNTLLKYCFRHSIRTYTTPKLSDILIRGAVDLDLFDTPLLLNRNQGLTLSQRAVKRALDLSLTIFGLIAAAPFMIMTALAIKISDGGPVLFLQDRCTINNRIFRIYKFRSMIVDAEKDGLPNPAIDNDHRITTVGRVIRKFRLDELPQLFNVLKGDMSIVGPRPERLEHVLKYTEEITEFDFRSKVKGGITGYAQIIGRYNTTAYDKLKMDLMYITNYSALEDLKLILMTLKILFSRESTAGFSKGKNDPPGR